MANLGVPTTFLGKRNGHDWGLALRIARLCRTLRPHLVHARNWGTMDAVIGARLARVPVVIHSEHGRDLSDLDGLRRARLRVRRLLAPFIDMHVAVSAHLQRWLLEQVRVRPEKVRVVHNGVDATRFKPLLERDSLRRQHGYRPTDLVFGAVGRLTPVKDYRTLLEAFHLLSRHHPHCRLILVGDGPERPVLEEHLRHRGLADRVRLVGHRDDVAPWLGIMDVFVHPSLMEGMSNAVLEAMAVALPVVATAVGGTPEIVAHGVTGLLVPPATPTALGEAMMSYCADDSGPGGARSRGTRTGGDPLPDSEDDHRIHRRLSRRPRAPRDRDRAVRRASDGRLRRRPAGPMCGFAGILDLAGAPDAERARVLARHDPDPGPSRSRRRGLLLDGSHVALGHRRLSIIDLETGRQPIGNEDGSVWVVLQRRDLQLPRAARARSKRKGHVFRTRSDTEAIVHAYEEWGVDCRRAAARHVRLRALGPAAAATAPGPRPARQEAALLRRRSATRFIFGSEIKALLAFPGLDRTLDLEAVSDYLSLLYIPREKTIFRRVQQAAAGALSGGRRRGDAGAPLLGRSLRARADERIAERRSGSRSCSARRWRIRLRSDVPLGAFLSGGLDSSAVVGLMARHASTPVMTSSIGFPDDGLRRADVRPAGGASTSAPITTSRSSPPSAVRGPRAP